MNENRTKIEAMIAQEFPGTTWGLHSFTPDQKRLNYSCRIGEQEWIYLDVFVLGDGKFEAELSVVLDGLMKAGSGKFSLPHGRAKELFFDRLVEYKMLPTAFAELAAENALLKNKLARFEKVMARKKETAEQKDDV